MARQFHGFCIGSGKTGTTSVAHMFQRFRSAHEPMPGLTNQIVIEKDIGRMSSAQAARMLRQRDLDLNLEMDSSHPLGFIPGLVAETFPKSRFLVTVRHPVPWLHSRLAYHYATDPPAWKAFRTHFWWNRPEDYSHHDEYLGDQYQLCPLDAYLGSYEEQYERIWNEMPYDRMLLVKTESLSDPVVVKKIALFFGVDAHKLVISHENKKPMQVKPGELLTDEYIQQRANLICLRAMDLYNAAI